MPKQPLRSILNHPNATEEMAEKAFLKAHEAFREAKWQRDWGTMENHSYMAQIAAGSRVFSKRLFDKYIDHPELSGHLTHSRHFNSWVDKVGFDKAMSHHNDDVQFAAVEHPDFGKWLDELGIDEALDHPSEHVQYAAADHPHFRKWVSKVGFDRALSHPHDYVGEMAAEHPKFDSWVHSLGKDRAMSHHSEWVQEAAKRLFNA